MTRIPPQAIDSEKALLGSLLQDNDACNDFIPLLKYDMFYDNVHATIFSAMELLFKDNAPIDQLTVSQKLRDEKKSIEISYIADLINRVPTSGNAKYYYDIVNEKYKRRLLIKEASGIVEKSYDTDDIDYIIDEFQKRMSESRRDELPTHSMKEMILNIDNCHVDFLKTGFWGFDIRYNGLARKELSIIAGRPSMGKSAYAMSLMLSMMKLGYKVVFFSLEMSKEIVMDRFLSMQSGILHNDIRKRNLPLDVMPVFREASKELYKLPFEICDISGLSVYDIKSMTRKFHRQGKCDIVFVDYLQIMKLISGRESTSEKLGMITRESKALAKELNIHVSVLSQLRRREVTKKDMHPHMDDLRSSGEIEQDADMVIFPFRPYVHDEVNYTPDQTQIIVAKNRNGATGFYDDIQWFPELVLFKEK